MDDPVGTLTATVAILTPSLGLLAGIFLGLQVAAAIFVVGWLLLVPLIPIVGEDVLAADEDTDESADPVERLKSRYVEGELTEEEFDRQLAQLLETEAVEPSGETGTVSDHADVERESDGG